MNLDDYDDDDPSHGNRNLLRTLVASMMMAMIIIIIITIISTESALKRPMTYDNQSHPSHPVRHIALNELNRPKIDLSP